MHDNSRHATRRAMPRRWLTTVVVGGVLLTLGYSVYRAPPLHTVGERIGGPPATSAGAATNATTGAGARAHRETYPQGRVPVAPRARIGPDGYYIPPAQSDIPAGAEGDAIRRGRDIFTRTGMYVKAHVGNQLACTNCHLDAGRRANAAPMWAAYGAYPAYRATTGAVITMEDRIRACFTYSMNAQDSASGKAPAPGSAVYRDLISYIGWLANGAPAGQTLQGAGYPRLRKPAAGYDLRRGQVVFQQNCAQCHGVNGQGARDDQGGTTFPPLWGQGSYNWGAGMAQVDLAAAFIKANMPLGKPGSLTEQQAWDVAAYIDSHERPRDPRQTGTVAAQAKKDHAGEDSFYGKTVAGHELGTGVVGGRSAHAG